MSKSIFSAIEKHLRQEQDELVEATIAAEETFPVIETLDRAAILNPVKLKAKLAKMSPKYRDAFYGLCQIATCAGPEGSYVVLDPEKVLAIIEGLEEYEAEKTPKKKSIFGVSKKIINSIKNLVGSKLSALCCIVNDVIIKKVINVPSPDYLKASALKVKALVKKKSKSKARG
jgi:DNA integrity scanning protein DisA with diadenylate cyclase activity